MSNGRQDTSRARLGVFVVCGIVLMAAGILALGWGRIFERTMPVYFYFDETVQGLEQGSPISYRGVKIGRVNEIQMAQVRARRGGRGSGHEAVIEVQGLLFPDQIEAFAGGEGGGRESPAEMIRREVREGLRVRVQWKDITGQKYLDVNYLDPDEYRPPELGMQPQEPYIPTAASPTLQDIQKDLATTLGSLAKVDYQRIGTQTQELLDTVNAKVKSLQLEQVTAALSDAAMALRDIAQSEELRNGLKRFDSLGADLQVLVRRTSALLEKPELDQGISDLAGAMRSLRYITEEMEKSLPHAVESVDKLSAEATKAIAGAKIPETTAAIRSGAEDVSGATRNVAALREDLRLAFREISEASRNIGRLADFLERHPESLLRGREGAER